MNAEQEKIIDTLTKRSMGAPFLFKPLRYRKNQTSNSPCDIAWACNGCIILFRMIDSARGREKMSRHNFNQMKSWFKEWHSGLRLRGSNTYCSFDIPFDQYAHKILISVAQGRDAASEWNPDAGEDLLESGCPSPPLCATISQNVLEYLAEHGGSMVDLLLFLSDLRDPLSAEASLRALRRRHNLCFNFTNFEQLCGDFRKDPRLYGTDPTYAALRSSGGIGGAAAGSWDSFVPSLLSDLSWFQLNQIVYQVRYLERKARNLPPSILGVRAASALLDFPPYLFGLIINKISGPPDLTRSGEHIGLLQKEMVNHANYRNRFSVIFRYNIGDQDKRSCSAFGIPAADETLPTLKSQTSEVIDGIVGRFSGS
jgi:hypothetical protein